jgi:hypothetical protein
MKPLFLAVALLTAASSAANACDFDKRGYVIAEGELAGTVLDVDSALFVLQPESLKDSMVVEIEEPSYDLFLLKPDDTRLALTAHCAEE